MSAFDYVTSTYQAIVDALLPTTSQFNGIQMKIHEYLMFGLNNNISVQQQLYHQVIPLAYPTAVMLDSAATQLVNTHQVQLLSQSQFPNGGMFSYLSRKDRVQTLSALENLHIDLYLLPSPFQNNAGMVKFVTDALNRFSMFGYYSEWPAYGTTRLNPPDYRRLEFFPPGWHQAGYPGVSFGYRDFRGLSFSMSEVKA
ncbi:hypothetical protein [Ornithinibacillus halophilus]|uniref:Uncharacterized protein n=1 Tax=Ornithinibacillus halophilus TaxID=930117 RepID=A0A1M5HEL2_9BACI|nr:hypothetical protein [Ornithinibacillus halophilus]SHG14419.1 hypothetical protein SAMN05216225_101729 [Ornithinibacillus halophilus]